MRTKKSLFVRPLILAALSGLLLLFISQYIAWQRYEMQVQREHRVLHDELNHMRDRLYDILYNDIAAANTLAIIVKDYGVPKDFDSIAKQITESSRYVEAIQLTDKGVITHVYPFKGYENTIGINTFADSLRKKEAEEAIIKGRAYFVGPRQLRQGGEGILAKVPIMRGNELIGFSVVLTKMETVRKVLGIDENDGQHFAYKLTKIKGEAEGTEYYLTNARPIDGTELVSLSVPEGNWRLSVGYASIYPRTNIYLISIFGILLSLAVVLIVYSRTAASRQLERLVQKRTHQLGERIKELSTIFSLNEILKDDRQSTQQVFKRIVDMLPGGWQYTDDCVASITFDGQRFESNAYRQAIHRQTTTFKLQDGREGIIEIGYFARQPKESEGPFLQEERNLINVIAETIQVYFNKKINQNALMHSEARFRSAFEDAAIGMALATLDGRWFEVNHALCNMLGYKEEELKGITFNELTHPDDLDKDVDAIQKLISGDLQYYRTHKRYIHKDGGIVWIILNVALVRNEMANPLYFVAQITNITERIESQMKFRSLVEKSLVGVYIIKDGRFVYVNPRIAEESAYSEAELLGQPVSILIHEDDIPVVQQHIHARLQGHEHHVRYEVRIKRKDGKILWAEMYGTSTLFEGGTAIIGTVVNVTDRKRLELERQEMINHLVQRNKDLEQFNQILSHNVRAPLATILGLSHFIRDMETEEERKFVVEGIENSALSLDMVISEMNEFLQAKRGLSEVGVIVKLDETMEEVKQALRKLVEDTGAVIEYDFSQLNVIEGVHAFIRSIFLNLVSNAIKFAREGVSPHIQIRSEKAEDKIVLTFRDNGMGIDMDRFGDQLFGLHKRFHHNIDGRGLGLFMIKTQVEALDGHIEVTSKVGEGSTFVISI